MKDFFRKHLPLITSILLTLIIIIFIGGEQLPKYARRLIIVGILFAIDMIYWTPTKRLVNKKWRPYVAVIYWMPLAVLLFYFFINSILPLSAWNSFFRAYYPAVMLILIIGKLSYLLVIFIVDIIKASVYLIKRNVLHIEGTVFRRSKVLLSSMALFSGMLMLLFFSGMIFWVHDYKVYNIDVPIKNLPQEFNDYKIVQLSDFHVGTYINDKEIKKISNIVNAQHPDAIVFTGDMVNLTSSEAVNFEKSFTTMHAPDGIYAILGNHDYGEYITWNSPEEKELDVQHLKDFYKRIGWKLLLNENKIIHKKDKSLAIVGVENWSVSKHFISKGNMQQAHRGAEHADIKILLSHDPSHWDAEIVPKYPDINLTLSGHTHAFQMAIEVGKIKMSPSSLLYKQWGGLYKSLKNNAEQYIYVNRGVGSLGYPGRIFTRPEITVLTLKNE